MSRKRITKKQLKEDAFVTSAFEAGHFIQENKNRIIFGGIATVALVGLVWLFVNYRIERAEAASLSLFQAEAVYMNGQYPLAATEFERLAEDFSGSAEAKKALFFAGDCYFKAGEYDKAREKFEQGRDKLSAEDPLIVNCVVGLAASLEQLKSYDQAAETYRQALDAAAYDYQKVEILAGLRRVLALAGKDAEAMQVLDRILGEFPDSPRRGEFEELKAELTARTSTAGMASAVN